MRRINFIPVATLNARRRRRRLRYWAVGVCAWAAAMLAIYLVFLALWGGDGRPQTGEMEALSRKMQEATREIQRSQQELVTAEASLHAAQTVGNQPDWSVLLALLAKTLGDDVVLRQCDLRAPAPAVPSDPLGKRNVEFVLKLAGYGRTQAAISRYALDLERAALFDNVKLVQTSREPFLASEAVGFQIDCWLGPTAGGAR